MNGLMYLRGKACKRVILAVLQNDVWSMKRLTRSTVTWLLWRLFDNGCS